MKKLLIMAMCLASAAGAFAQEDVLKNADRALKGEMPKYAEISKSLRGAMADPTTSGQARTWFLAGKSGFGQWDQALAALQLGSDVDRKASGRALIDGYKFYLHALPLDTVVDAKGKIKTKYSKDIVKAIVAHYNDFYNAGAFLYESEDFTGAYEAWDIYTSMPQMTDLLGKLAPEAPADTIMAQNLYNMGIFAYTAKMYPEATEAFYKATLYDYPGCDAFNNAIACAGMAGNNDRKFEIAKEAFEKRGSENAGYIGEIINGYIDRKQFGNAMEWLDRAIAADGSNAQLYNAKGILVESQIPEDASPEVVQKSNEEALELYKKAVELQPENGMWNYHYGRMLSNKGVRIVDASAELPASEYNKVLEQQVFPIYREAIIYLEKAIAADPDNTRGALPLLRNIYYNLGDNENMQRIEAMQ